MVDGAVGAPDVYLEAAVGVGLDRWVAGRDSAQAGPSRPAAVRRDLVVMPHGAVAVDGEQFQAAVNEGLGDLNASGIHKMQFRQAGLKES